jgi:hypothetical protein
MAASDTAATPPSTTDQPLLRMMAAYGRIVPGTLPRAGRNLAGANRIYAVPA